MSQQRNNRFIGSVFEAGLDAVGEVVGVGEDLVDDALDLLSEVTPDVLEDSLNLASNLAPLSKEDIENLFDIVSGGAIEVAENASGLIKDQVEVIALEGFEVALSTLNGEAFKKFKDNAKALTDIKNWTPSNLANGALTITTAVMKEAYENAKEGYEIIKDIAAEIYKYLLILLAQRLVGPAGKTLKTLIGLASSLPDIKKGITTGDPKKILSGLSTLITSNDDFKTVIEQLQKLDAGSLVISIDGSAANIVEQNASIGVAISLDVLDHMITNNGSLDNFNGPVMSFISSAGIALFSAGINGDITIGFDVGTPDDVDGYGIDVNLSLKAKVGGTVSIGFDPLASFPPDLTSMSVGLGGGASVEASIGGSYCSIIAVYHTDDFDSPNRSKPGEGYFVTTAQSNTLTTLPSTTFIKKTSNPKRFWLQHKWQDIPREAQVHWQTLGWNTSGRSFTDSPVAIFKTKWDSLKTKKNAAKALKALGFTKATWDNTKPSGIYIRSIKSVTNGEQRSASNRGTGGIKSDIDTYWDRYKWNDLGKEEQRLWRMLGINSENFPPLKGLTNNKNGKVPAIKYRKWRELTVRQRKAATFLGYDETTWITISPEKHGAHINFTFPDGNTNYSEYVYFSTPSNTFAIPNVSKTPRKHPVWKLYVLNEEIKNGSRWSEMRPYRSIPIEIEHQQPGTSFSLFTKDIISLSIKSNLHGSVSKVLSFLVNKESSYPELSSQLAISTQDTPELDLGEGAYITSFSLQRVPTTERDTDSYKSLKTPCAYLKLETNKGQSIQGGRLRNINAQSEDKLHEIQGEITRFRGSFKKDPVINTELLNWLKFEYTPIDKEPNFVRIGNTTAEKFGSCRLEKTFFIGDRSPEEKMTLELFGDKYITRMGISGRQHGHKGNSTGKIILEPGEYINHVYAETGKDEKGHPVIGYLKITTSRGQRIIGGGISTHIDAKCVSVRGKIFTIGSWADNHVRELIIFRE